MGRVKVGVDDLCDVLEMWVEWKGYIGCVC